MGNVPFCPRDTVMETISVIENYSRALNKEKKEEKNTTKPEFIADIHTMMARYRDVIQKHAENAKVILDKTTPADVNDLIKMALDVHFRIDKHNPKDEEDAIKQTILDGIIATISKHQGTPYTLDEKTIKKYELQRQLREIQSELTFLEKARHSAYAPPEYEISYQRYCYIVSEIQKQLATLA
jgi:hypothetical protein